MSVISSRPALRWLVPAAAVAVVVGGGAAVGTFAASAEPSLPPRTAQQLLVDLQTARLDGLSGTVVQSADLGLPALPALSGGGSGSADIASLVTGTNTLRVWYSGPDKARVALMGTLGETDVIRNGSDLWLWSSQENKASHRKISEADTEPHALPMTPQEAADRALAAVDPTTEVTVGRSATIAGRDAYELVLAPRDKTSLVGEVRIAIDAAEYVPLRLEVFPKGTDHTAFQIAFTQVEFARPDDEQFEFNPPPNAKIEESDDTPKAGEQPKAPEESSFTTVGEGWTTVAVIKGTPPTPASDAEAKQEAQMLGALPSVSGAWGSGRLFTSKLFNVLLTDDGRLFAGMVAPERLYEVAQEHK
ncbi:LolA family protein [Phytohabitans kaempferiae]|uniref:Outer membrane lipoprotein carrier protein LolA n=1 Tax=Phytohabitans kaempferiae TaxID=1620943 RepID=A0ABV6LYB5_9ACTN